jgi:hypothetical protein
MAEQPFSLFAALEPYITILIIKKGLFNRLFKTPIP